MKEYRGVIVKVFVTLLVLTVSLFLYKQVNPYFFPGLEYRMLWMTCIFGILTFIFSFNELIRIPSSWAFKRSQEFLKNHYLKEKALAKKNYALFSTAKNTREKLEKSFERGHEYKSPLRVNFIEHAYAYKNARAYNLEQLSRKLVLSLNQAKDHILTNKLKFLEVCASALIAFLLIVWLASLKLSWEKYAFFVMLAYIPISLKLNLDFRLPIIAALSLLSLCPILLIQNFEVHASRAAVFAYYFLVIGVILALIEYRRGDEK